MKGELNGGGTYTVQKIGKMLKNGVFPGLVGKVHLKKLVLDLGKSWMEGSGFPVFILFLMIVGTVIITLLRWIDINKIIKNKMEVLKMTDVEKESINMSLDAICKKLYEKAEPRITCNLDALSHYEIIDKIKLLENMVNVWWGLQTELATLQLEHQKIVRTATSKIQTLERELDSHIEGWAKAEEKIIILEARLRRYQNKPEEEREVPASVLPKTKKGNKNAMRKDIDAIEVYNLVKGGMSISKVAEKFHASRATIRKYYIAGENECLYYLEN